MQLRHDFAHLLREDICPARSPLSQFDESWPRPFHRANKEAIPPYRARTISILRFSLAKPHKGDRNDNGHKDDGKVEEAETRCDGFVDVLIQHEYYAFVEALEATSILRYLFAYLFTGGFEHRRFGCLPIAFVFLAELDEGCGGECSSRKDDTNTFYPLLRVFQAVLLGPLGKALLSARYRKEDIGGAAPQTRAPEVDEEPHRALEVLMRLCVTFPS